MKDPDLLAYYYTQKNEILAQVEPARKLDSEAIHLLRVAIKKIRAYTKFLHGLSGGETDVMKHLDALNVVFKYAGKIRDAQVQEQLLLVYSERLALSFGRFQKFLRRRQKKQQPRFLKALKCIDEKLFRKSDKYIHAQFQEADLNKLTASADKLAEERLRLLGKLKKHRGNEDCLHDFRKAFKETMYVFKFGSVFFENFTPPFEHKRMDAFAERLGKWHDQTVLLDYLLLYKRNYKLKNKLKKLKERLKLDTQYFMDDFERLLLLEKIVV